MKLLYGILATLFALVLGALAFAYSGIYDVSASSAHSAPVRWLLHTTYHASMARRAEAVTVPDLTAERLRLAGAGDFDAMCAICHGAPGREPGALGQGLNPAAPDLAESARHLTDAELFWETKHGIRMTGMPAWARLTTTRRCGRWSRSSASCLASIRPRIRTWSPGPRG
jgi:mono/diheme cytochrome c family protein